MIPVAVLGSHTMGYGVIRSLGERKIPITAIYYDEEDFGFKSKYVNKILKFSNPTENPEDFLNTLVNFGIKQKGTLLIPTNDETLYIVSKNKPLLNNYFLVCANDWSVIQNIIDKRFTYQIADELNITTPKTLYTASLEEIENFCNHYESTIIKPLISHKFYSLYNKKFLLVRNFDRAKLDLKKLEDEKIDVMLQELINSNDSDMVMYNAYYIKGNPIIELTARKLRNGPAVYGNSTVSISEKIDEIVAPSRKILNFLQYNGYCCLEYRKDLRDNKYKFLEINGRYNLSNTLMKACGYDVSWIEYKYYTNAQMPNIPSNFEEKIYWIDIFRDLTYTVPRIFKREMSLIDFLKPYIAKHTFAILSLRDIRPFIKRGINLAKFIFKNLNKALAYKKSQHY